MVLLSSDHSLFISHSLSRFNLMRSICEFSSAPTQPIIPMISAALRVSSDRTEHRCGEQMSLKRSNRRIKRVFLYPCHRIIGKFPLPHQSDSRIADLRHPDRVLFFKIHPDLLKILAIHEQGFVGLPTPVSRFPKWRCARCTYAFRIFCPSHPPVHGCSFCYIPVPSKSTLPLSA